MTLFVLQPSSGMPIYRQIAEQAAGLIVGGHLGAGERLPSAGAVAAEHGINAVSVTKAYAVLERDGLVAGGVVRDMLAYDAGDAADVTGRRLRALAEAACRQGLARSGVVEAVDAIWRAHRVRG